MQPGQQMVPHEMMMMQHQYIMQQQHMIQQQQQQLVGGQKVPSHQENNLYKPLSCPPPRTQVQSLPLGQAQNITNIAASRASLSSVPLDVNVQSPAVHPPYPACLSLIPRSRKPFEDEFNNGSNSSYELGLMESESPESLASAVWSLSLLDESECQYQSDGRSDKMGIWPWKNIWSLGDYESQCRF